MDEVHTDQKEAPQEPVKEDPSDKLTPDHPRFKQVLEKLDKKDEELQSVKQELQELKSKLQERKDVGGEGELSAEEEAALSKIDAALKKRGYITQAELESVRKVDQNATVLERLTEKHDGRDGLPKFIAEDVVAFAKRNGYGSNYDAAYRQMHFDAIVEIEAKRRGDGHKPPASEKPTGGERMVPGGTFTSEQIASMSPDEYEKHRAAILSGLRPR